MKWEWNSRQRNRSLPNWIPFPRDHKANKFKKGRTIDKEEACFPEKDFGAKALAPEASTKTAERHPEVKFTIFTNSLLLQRNKKDWYVMEWFWQKLRVFPFNESKDFRIRQLKPFFRWAVEQAREILLIRQYDYAEQSESITKLSWSNTVGNALNASTWKCESPCFGPNSVQRLHVSAYHSRLRQSRRDRKPGSLFIRRSHNIFHLFWLKKTTCTTIFQSTTTLDWLLFDAQVSTTRES